MKLLTIPSQARAAQPAYLLMECLVYIAVFAILLGVGTGGVLLLLGSFEGVDLCHGRHRLRLARGRTLARGRARCHGKNHRRDHGSRRSCCGFPEERTKSFYRFECRRSPPPIRRHRNFAESLLANVKASQMAMDARGAVTAWRWELELKPRRKETHLPLLFTFEAAADNHTMKILYADNLARKPAARQNGEGGFASSVFIALLAIMVMLVIAEQHSAVSICDREVKFLEQQQIKRLNASQTNAVSMMQNCR